MKSFLTFISEDIELMLRSPKNWALGSPQTFDEFAERRRRPGANHPFKPASIGKYDGFEVWEQENGADELMFIIVDTKNNMVAGLLKMKRFKDRVQADTTELQNEYQGKGGGIATGAYKVIAKKYDLQSSGLQSIGGSSVWKRLINDPELAGRLFLRDKEGNFSRLKVGEKEENIWATSSSAQMVGKTTPKFSRETKTNTKRVNKIYYLTILIKKA